MFFPFSFLQTASPFQFHQVFPVLFSLLDHQFTKEVAPAAWVALVPSLGSGNKLPWVALAALV
ncbi:hypothetical protein LNTAR_02042 [Lentisphaera araneosa HTCC2155]|uniref:Uncharacterized protein n=1 Tax=Lentisphaera araneosa HTCC2155 TaxID=313628 RepID=A6DP18_9BACT|nr:hypothetical protein LNTAR_02042 [Lentisphaera araneosa HTCC2155]